MSLLLARVGFKERHQALAVGVGQRLEQNGVDDGLQAGAAGGIGKAEGEDDRRCVAGHEG